MIGTNIASATIIESDVSGLLTFKLILELNNNWEEYKQNQPYTLRQAEIKEVEKMLMCMDPDQGYSVYMCEECGNTKTIPHTCKSRICSTCGKKHADEWAEKINQEMYAVPYRHIILTVSDRLWAYFEGNSILQKLMLDTAAKVMKDIVKNFNKTNQVIFSQSNPSDVSLFAERFDSLARKSLICFCNISFVIWHPSIRLFHSLMSFMGNMACLCPPSRPRPVVLPAWIQFATR